MPHFASCAEWIVSTSPFRSCGDRGMQLHSESVAWHLNQWPHLFFIPQTIAAVNRLYWHSECVAITNCRRRAIKTMLTNRGDKTLRSRTLSNTSLLDNIISKMNTNDKIKEEGMHGTKTSPMMPRDCGWLITDSVARSSRPQKWRWEYQGLRDHSIVAVKNQSCILKVLFVPQTNSTWCRQIFFMTFAMQNVTETRWYEA